MAKLFSLHIHVKVLLPPCTRGATGRPPCTRQRHQTTNKYIKVEPLCGATAVCCLWGENGWEKDEKSWAQKYIINVSHIHASSMLCICMEEVRLKGIEGAAPAVGLSISNFQLHFPEKHFFIFLDSFWGLIDRQLTLVVLKFFHSMTSLC